MKLFGAALLVASLGWLFLGVDRKRRSQIGNWMADHARANAPMQIGVDKAAESADVTVFFCFMCGVQVPEETIIAHATAHEKETGYFPGLRKG